MGTEARLCLDPATWYSGLRMWIERDNIIEQKDLPEVDHFATEMDHMSDCVMQNKQPLTPGEEGLRDLTIIAGIYEAARSGKTVKL
jgi:predicted dehydrogenase